MEVYNFKLDGSIKRREFLQSFWKIDFFSLKISLSLSLHKICNNTGFHWPVFSRIRAESYGRIRVIQNLYSRIFYTVWHTTALVNLNLNYVFWLHNFRTLQMKFALKWLPLKNFFMKRQFSKQLFIQNLVCWLQLWLLGFYGRCLSEIRILVSPYIIYMLSVCKICQNTCWPVFSRIRTESGKIRTRENLLSDIFDKVSRKDKSSFIQ